MANWLKMPANIPTCCFLFMSIRKGKDAFSKDGGEWVCPECGQRFMRVGEEIHAKERCP